MLYNVCLFICCDSYPFSRHSLLAAASIIHVTWLICIFTVTKLTIDSNKILLTYFTFTYLLTKLTRTRLINMDKNCTFIVVGASRGLEMH